MFRSALSVFLFCLLGRLECTGQTEVKVKSGADATLECSGPRDATIILLKWSKPDLQSKLYVFYFRDNHSYENYQDPSFKSRVKLKDPEMKNGDISVILKSVTMNDAGVYECYAGYNNQEAKLVNNILLKVEEQGQTGGQSGDGGNEDDVKKDGSVGLIVGLVVSAVLLVVAAVVGFLIYRKRRDQPNPGDPPDDQVL